VWPRSDALGPRKILHRRASHGHVSNGRASHGHVSRGCVPYRRHLHLIGVYLTGVHLMGVYLKTLIRDSSEARWKYRAFETKEARMKSCWEQTFYLTARQDCQPLLGANVLSMAMTAAAKGRVEEERNWREHYRRMQKSVTGRVQRKPHTPRHRQLSNFNIV
jgi:hypothetical protein